MIFQGFLKHFGDFATIHSSRIRGWDESGSGIGSWRAEFLAQPQDAHVLCTAGEDKCFHGAHKGTQQVCPIQWFGGT